MEISDDVIVNFIILFLTTISVAFAQLTTCISLGLTPNTDPSTCTCDLTSDGCDVNCCCDPDCNSDLLAFSTCIDKNIPVNIKLCYLSVVMFANNTPTSVMQMSSGLFCIYTDNYQRASYYDVPSKLCSTELFNKSIAQYQSYLYNSQALELSITNAFYKSGDPIYTVYLNGAGNGSSYGIFSIPLTAGTCMSGPIPYLSDLKASCQSVNLDLSNSCVSGSILDANYYYSNFKLVSSPAIVNVTGTAPNYDNVGLRSISVQDPICLNDAGIITDCRFSNNSIPHPSYNSASSSCSDAVTGILYSVAYNGTNGIISVSVTFTFKNITGLNLPLTQTFETKFYQFHGVTVKDVLRYSGNPGYLVGQPVLVGTYDSNNRSGDGSARAIKLNTDRNNWLTMVVGSTKSIPFGRCTQESRAIVQFGINARSGCIVQFTYDNITTNCIEVSKILQGAILPGYEAPSYVAKYGNSPVTSILDWVGIEDNSALFPTAVPLAPGGCSNMITGLDIQITYVKDGSIKNPQAQITQVLFNYKYQDILFQCAGSYCQLQTMQKPQKFEIISSVTFIDASSPPVAESGQVPRSKTRLPRDFLYPFQ